MSEASDQGGLAWPPTKEDLERLHLDQKLSAAKIAKAYGLKYKNAKVAESTVLYELKKNGIKRRDRADHVRKVTEEMVDEWASRYRAGKSLKQIAGEGFSPVTVFLHLRKRGLQLRDKVEAQIQAVTKHERRPFDGCEIDRAYLVGFTKGDCQTIRHGRAIRVRTSTTHPDMEILFSDLFGRFGSVHRYPRKSKLTGYEWSLEVDLDGTFEFLLKTADEALAEYARSAATFLSFLDTLGHFSRIRILNQGLIRLSYEKSGKIGRLIVWRHSDVIRLLQLLPLRHGEKRAKADLALAFMQMTDKKVRRETLDQWNALLSSIDRGRKDFVLEAERRYLAKHKLGDSQT